ncbi:Deoxyribodipyrimidine photo-lyase-like 2, partial [Homarus americanus]
MMSKADEVPAECDGIVYWMCRDQRVQDNWAMLFAQRLALKNKVSLHVAFCLIPKFLDATIRQYHFMLKGLEEVENECQKLGIEFHLLHGEAKDVLPKIIEEHHIGGLVTDFSPLRLPQEMLKDVKETIPKNIPMCKVDAHNIVPCWLASDKQEYSAKTIRRKIQDKLPDFLTKFPPVAKHSHESKYKAKLVDWTAAEKSLEVDRTVKPVEWATPGTHAGLDTLNQFCLKRLRKYATQRNNPNAKSLSNLSPWLHFGQISAQRCVLEVKRYRKQFKDAADDFIEEAVVRCELSDNYCFYQKNYDCVEGAYNWAITTLNDH